MVFYKSMAELRTELRTKLRDTGTNKSFSDGEIKQAIFDAVEFYSERIFVSDVYEDRNNQVDLAITGSPTSGGYNIGYDGSTTTITYDATSATIQTALRALDTELAYVHVFSLGGWDDNITHRIILNKVPDMSKTLSISTSTLAGGVSPEATVTRKSRTTLVSNQRIYELPSHIDKVTKVERKHFTKENPSASSDTVNSPWISIIFRYNAGQDADTNSIYIHTNHITNLPMRVSYERGVRVPPDEGSTLNGAITAEDDLIVISSGDNAYQWSLPAYVRIDNEVLRVDSISGTDTLYELTRGMFGTLSVDHSSASTVTPLIVTRNRSDYALLKNRTLLEIYESAISDGNESRASIWITLQGSKLADMRQMEDKVGARREPEFIETKKRRPTRGIL